MNYVIGLCKGNKNWVNVLRELHYDVEIIEKDIRTSGGHLVKPDIIKTSKRFNHAIVFECKSGSADIDQMTRYGSLTNDDVLRWVEVPQREQFSFDVCIVDFENNHQLIVNSTAFPIITFGNTTITRTHDFSNNLDLNSKFGLSIDTSQMTPPLDYYPFSDSDSDQVIIPRILRAMITLVMKRARGGPDVFDHASYQLDEVLQRIHPLWSALSDEHRTALRERIRNILTRLLASNSELAQHLHNIQRGGFQVRGPPDSFTALCESIIEEAGIQTTFDQNFT